MKSLILTTILAFCVGQAYSLLPLVSIIADQVAVVEFQKLEDPLVVMHLDHVLLLILEVSDVNSVKSQWLDNLYTFTL